MRSSRSSPACSPTSQCLLIHLASSRSSATPIFRSSIRSSFLWPGSLWHVVDPGNVGTVLRTSDGLGPAFVALSSGCADPTGPKALRASAGAVFRVPIGRFEAAPRPRIALVTRGGTVLAEAELPERTTFVLGAEREGLPDDIVRDCDVQATIPLAPTAESLNVAVTAAIALYEWSSRHRRPRR